VVRVDSRAAYRTVRARARARAAGREEARFRTGLHFDAHAPAVLLSPHLDDAVLDCWAVLVGEASLNVVNIFAGVPPASQAMTVWDEMTGAASCAQRVRERIAEDAAALALAGREPINLALLDVQYRRGSTPALQALDAQLAGSVHSASRIYAPAAIGRHSDHLLIRRYALALARAGIPLTLYADLPYSVLHGWPAWVDGSEPDPHRNVDAYWQSFLEGVPQMPPLRSGEVVCLDDAQAARKLAAMRAYTSQFPCLDYGGGRVMSDGAIHRYELSWSVGAQPMSS
jgi:hypothetical protein